MNVKGRLLGVEGGWEVGEGKESILRGEEDGSIHIHTNTAW
jgi:hypothetical protein